MAISHFREITQDRMEEFFYKGYKKRHFFPHKTYYLPKAGPDGLELARRMCKSNDPNKLWEIILYACNSDIADLPRELFSDNDLIWHQQQFGRIGQIATANLVVKGSDMYGINYLSDFVQRISRQEEYKTRIRHRFSGWSRMLANSIMNFALENRIKRFYSATADLVIANTDPKRKVQRELFERVYDGTILKHFQAVKKQGWWIIDVAKNINKVIVPEEKKEAIEYGQTICICYALGGNLAYIDSDPKPAKPADRISLKVLEKTLSIGKELKIKATYFIPGRFLNALRRYIENDGHCIAFHAYDRHKDQLLKCREIDYRIKGYMPLRSKITSALSDKNLCGHNFEWLANSACSLKTRIPKMRNRIVKIPILFDDSDMYKNKTGYNAWEQRAMGIIKENAFVAFCLHDCYANYWLPRHSGFLKQVSGLGKIRTLDEVANEMILTSAV